MPAHLMRDRHPAHGRPVRSPHTNVKETMVAPGVSETGVITVDEDANRVQLIGQTVDDRN